MGSPALEAMSPNSTVRRIRKADAVGRLRARSEYYLWFFGHIHVKGDHWDKGVNSICDCKGPLTLQLRPHVLVGAKQFHKIGRLLIFLHFFLLTVSVCFMCAAGSDGFAGIAVPGLDGFRPFGLPHENQPNQELDSVYVSTATTIERPFLYTSRNIMSGLGYFYLFSTLMGLIALRALDGVWQREGVTPVRCTLRTLLLLPFLLSMVSFGGGLFLWSVRVIRMRFHTISSAHADESVAFLILESIRFVFLPCAIIWAVYLYIIYGCMLGFVFVYRRLQQFSSQKNGSGTVNSASWSFRDRSSCATKSSDRLNIKQGFLTRLSVGNRSWRTYKCADNPTLRSYTKKVEGEDHSLSLLSEEVNVSFGSETSENNNLSRSFCGFNSSHRPLDTVHEECESQESTTLSSETAGPASVNTRM